MHLFSTDSQSKFLARRNPLTIAEGPSIARLLGLVKTAVMVVIRTVGRRRLQRKVICLAVAVNLLLWPGPGILARDLLTQASQVFTIHIDFSSYAAVFLKRLFSTAPARPRHETTAERAAAVATIKLNPVKYVGYVDETITLAALPADYLSRTVQGVTFSWESSSTDKVQIDDSGRATLLQPGLARVTCRAGAVIATAPVLVRPGHRPRQTDAEWRADQAPTHRRDPGRQWL